MNLKSLVGMVLEKATRVRAKVEHEERLRNEGKALLQRTSVAHDSVQVSVLLVSDSLMLRCFLIVMFAVVENRHR